MVNMKIMFELQIITISEFWPTVLCCYWSQRNLQFMQNIVHMKENVAVWNMFSAPLLVKLAPSKQTMMRIYLRHLSMNTKLWSIKVFTLRNPTANCLPTEKYIAILSVSLESLNQLEAPNAVWYRDRYLSSADKSTCSMRLSPLFLEWKTHIFSGFSSLLENYKYTKQEYRAVELIKS